MEKYFRNHAKFAGNALLVFAAGGFAYWLYRAGKNFAGPLKQLGISSITRKYDPQQRKGEIVFYGASNFTRWAAMEKDIPQYKVQNHGFGGSTDQDLIDYASVLLYPYQPTVSPVSGFFGRIDTFPIQKKSPPHEPLKISRKSWDFPGR